ncbi:MAG: hypothetical protein U1E82_07465 [Nitrosomonas sp.]|nr:hypothetical protein [Nitrosomonas sp.]
MHKHIIDFIASDATKISALIYSPRKRQSAEVWWQIGLLVQPFFHVASWT